MPPLRGPSRNNAIPFSVEKLELCGYSMVEKFDDMFCRFDAIPASDGRIERQTSCNGIVRAMHNIAR